MRAKGQGIFRNFGWSVVLLIGCAAGCAGVSAEQCKTDEPVADAQRIWQSQHLRDYQFVWQRTCFCVPEFVQPIRVTVRDGVIAAATDLSGVPVDDSVRQGLSTIDALYQRMLDADRVGEKLRFECVGAGVPGQIYIDPNPTRADDEFRVRISEFSAGAGAPGAANIH